MANHAVWLNLHTCIYFFVGKELDSEVSYERILSTICREDLKFTEKLQLEVSPCTFWKAFHDGEPFMALAYDGNEHDNNFKIHFSEFINDALTDKGNVLKANCVHLDAKLSHHPILLFEPKESLQDYCTSYGPGTISEVEQLSILLEVALGTLGFSSNIHLKISNKSIFVNKDNGKITALFSPLYESSYFSQVKQSIEHRSRPNFDWIREAVLLMHHGDQYNRHTELPESHILYNIFKYKWFSDNEKVYPKDISEVAKEIEYILGEYIM